MTPYDRLLLPENLNYAWRKAKRLYRMADGYVDSGEIAEFELDLEHRLGRIHRRFKQGHYRLRKLRPLPRPKKLEHGKVIDRQYFHVAVDDQVAWIAVANALGPELDQLMPPWSYGNRMYRPAWYEEDEHRKSKLEIGPYRHESGHLYRRFQHSWPLFRRHVTLTARAMVRRTPSTHDDLDQADRLALASADKDNLPYLRAGFWTASAHLSNDRELHHASVDLKQFYPSIRSAAVLRGLAMAEHAFDKEDRLRPVLEDMLRFRLDKVDMTEDTLAHVEPPFGGQRIHGIPTGLFVAGFLANVAMLPIDSIVSRRIEEERSIAHFRFVDDHTILAYDFEELCKWIKLYQTLLDQHDTGAKVNNDKYDPDTLGVWMRERETMASQQNSPSRIMSRRPMGKRDVALRDTKMDGANPIKLLTKTLGQVSVIAATNPDILDDEDLEKRLKLLEWLLLADIPEREIRPDTRAAFAAGKIAALAPTLIQEEDGLIDAARSLASLKGRTPKAGEATDDEIDVHACDVREMTIQVDKLLLAQRRHQWRHLEHCFELLLQAFREYPGKSRLFFRLHQYCQRTGYKGLSGIAKWINEMRDRGHSVWADYYAGLSLQMLAVDILLAARALSAVDTLRSDREAALHHLDDVASMDTAAFFVPRTRETWFHGFARRGFGVTLLSVSHVIREEVGNEQLAVRLETLSGTYIGIDFSTRRQEWETETGRVAGVWANIIEGQLSVNERPSSVWKLFEPCFSYSKVPDCRAARRYPEVLSDRGWNYLLRSEKAMNMTDAGWIREAMNGDQARITDGRLSKRAAFTRAARSHDPHGSNWFTLAEWTEVVSTECSPFDPRRSEWTALEIVRQIVCPIVEEPTVTEERLDGLHPNNVLISKAWKTAFPLSRESAGVSWEGWRSHVRRTGKGAGAVGLRGSKRSVIDYRYVSYMQHGRGIDEWERRLHAVGRVLLGVVCLNHGSPRLWNIRGNEGVIALPRVQMFASLAISTPTVVLLEGCLGGRSAETRAIRRRPGLFGLREGTEANDTEFDAPLLFGANALLVAIEDAQRVLKSNQLAVAMNQPRQLIPFRLKDFAIGPDGSVEKADDDG